VQTNALVDHGRFPLRTGKNWSCSSLCTPTVRYTVNWLPFTTIWIYSHPTACCCVFLLLPGLCTIFICTSSVIFSMAVLALLWWTEWCLQWCSLAASGELAKAPVTQLNSDLLTPFWGVCGALIHCCWKIEEDDDEKKGEVLRNI
jgi:hypothetical protein